MKYILTPSMKPQSKKKTSTDYLSKTFELKVAFFFNSVINKTTSLFALAEWEMICNAISLVEIVAIIP